jgi:hypothetical protein
MRFMQSIAAVLLIATCLWGQNGQVQTVGGGSGVSAVGRVFLSGGAKCQAGVAAASFSLPAAAYPAAVCVTGIDSPATVKGVVQFADSGTMSVQDHITLPADWTGTLKLYGKWRANVADANKSVVWQVQTKCVANGEVLDSIAWNAAQAITSAAKVVANQDIDFAEPSLTVTGCTAGEEMYLYLFRDPAHVSDTLAATAELIRLLVKE